MSSILFNFKFFLRFLLGAMALSFTCSSLIGGMLLGVRGLLLVNVHCKDGKDVWPLQVTCDGKLAMVPAWYWLVADLVPAWYQHIRVWVWSARGVHVPCSQYTWSEPRGCYAWPHAWLHMTTHDYLVATHDLTKILIGFLLGSSMCGVKVRRVMSGESMSRESWSGESRSGETRSGESWSGETRDINTLLISINTTVFVFLSTHSRNTGS